MVKSISATSGAKGVKHDKMNKTKKTGEVKHVKQESAETIQKRAKVLNVSLEVAAEGHDFATSFATSARLRKAQAKKAHKTAKLLQISLEQAAALNERAYFGDAEARHELEQGRLQSLAVQLQTTLENVEDLQSLANQGNEDAKNTLRGASQQILAARHELEQGRLQSLAVQLQTSLENVEDLQSLADQGNEDAKNTLRGASQQILAARHELEQGRLQSLAVQLQTSLENVEDLQSLADQGNEDAKNMLRDASQQILA